MPRQSRGSAPARRPMAPPPRPAAPPARAPPPQQSRPASTAVAPPPQTQAAPVSQGPGLFGQMASTAAGVAVGSSIGHAIGGFFGGGSSSSLEQQHQQQDGMMQSATGSGATGQYQAPRACEADVLNFRQCMDQNQGSLTICGWYLDQLKACQAAASQY